MAPRSAKAKKAVDVKVAENDAPKKGRGKAKNVTEPEPEVADVDLEVKPVAVAEKKPAKRGNNKTTNENKEVAVPAKKGRKKKAESGDNEDEPASNGDQSTDESSSQVEATEQNDENVEANGHTDEVPSSGRGRKKQAKPAAEKPETKSGRGRKNARQDVTEDKEEAVEEKQEKKVGGRGKGQKTAKAEVEQEDGSDIVEEEEKPKGRKRAPPKKVEEDAEDEEQQEEEEEKPEPKKKEPKAKKGKKAQLKEDDDDDEEENETSSKKKKVNKKEEKAKDEDVPEVKPAKGKRGQKKAAEPTPEADDVVEPTNKRRRKAAEEKATEDTNKKAPPKNKSVTDFECQNFCSTSVTTDGKPWNFKISSWNVDGIRAWLSKGCLDYLKYEKPNILCLQEVKCSQDKLPSELKNLPGYHAYWLAGEKDGYAGVGFYTTKLAMNVTYGLQNEELDTEGRIITAEYEQFYLVCTYVPNSGRKLVTLPKRLQWNEEFRKYVKELDKKKPVIICGDMNVSHQEIDLANPKTNRKNAGFTDEERQGMTELLGDGFVDTFRHLYPDKTDAYTFWTYMSNSRARNVGWRLDYFVISERLLPALCDTVIRDEVYGSDHCPLTLYLHLSSANKPKE